MLYPSIGQGWVDAPPKAGDFTGSSWLFTRFIGESGTRTLGTVAFTLVAILFVTTAVGLTYRQSWAPGWLALSAVTSTLMFALLWDGRLQALDEKGFIGVLINFALLVGMYAFRYPAL
jgi:hypothetical protein